MGIFGKKQQLSFTVPEMSCGHCEKRIEEMLKSVDGVAAVKADSSTRTTTLTLKGDNAPSLDQITAALGDSGYTAEFKA